MKHIEIDLKEQIMGLSEARVEDRLRLPIGSAHHVSHVSGRVYLRFDTELAENQRQQLKQFLGDKIA